jgi:hypothetical protein
MYHSVPKGGRKRWVFSPPKREKCLLRMNLPRLHQWQEAICDPEVVHGFYRGRSAVTNAMQHVGHQYTLSMDLENFFPSVTAKMFWDVAAGPTRSSTHLQTVKMFVIRTSSDPPKGELKPDGIAEQGLPTSPLVANIAFSPIDKLILGQLWQGVTYTRYADDLTFSWDHDPSNRSHIMERVVAVVSAGGFKINQRKTRFQNASFGRRIITGVGVDWFGVHATREAKRKLRAAKHNGWHLKAAGYAEWCAMRASNKNSWVELVARKVTRMLSRKISTEAIAQEMDRWGRRSSHPEWIEAINYGKFLARIMQ